MDTLLLSGILLVFGVSTVILFVCQQLRLPAIVGLLFTGVLIGPSALGLVHDAHEVDTLAEIGVIALLFTIGMEFSLAQLLRIKKTVLVGGALQVSLTILAASLAAWYLGSKASEAVFIGFLMALSSTAIVMKTLQEKAEVDSPHGRTSLGILIFQDIVIVPLMLITPILGGTAGSPLVPLLVLLGKGALIIVFVILAVKFIVPNLLYQIIKTRSPDLFLLSIVVICFGVAWLTSAAGLSLALGAFLAGLIISETEYSHSALGNILPLKGIFSTFFFVSIGMMLDVSFFWRQIGFILLLTLVVMVAKALISGLVSRVLGFPLRTSILVGFALCQLGEFSFILSQTGIEYKTFSTSQYQTLLAMAIISMAATPLLLSAVPKALDFFADLPATSKWFSKMVAEHKATPFDQSSHLVIIGFGLTGGNVVRAIESFRIPYVVIEMNPDTVRRQKEEGKPIYYGDASFRPVLEHVNIEKARIVLVAINDPAATRRITENVRAMSPNAHIIVRTRYVQEMKRLYELGANEVIPEEFETSVEIFARILARYLVPKDQIEKIVVEIRSDGYDMFRQLHHMTVSFSDMKQPLNDIDISVLKIATESPLIDQTLSSTAMRKRYGVSVVALKRNATVFVNPEPDVVFQADDVLFLLGSQKQIAEVLPLFTPQKGEPK